MSIRKSLHISDQSPGSVSRQESLTLTFAIRRQRERLTLDGLLPVAVHDVDVIC